MLSVIRESFSDLFNLFYPNICLACSEKLLTGELVICFRCESDLPCTDHFANPDNKLVRRLTGRVSIEGAAAYYVFHEGNPVQHLLHQLKYRGRKDVGDYIGKVFGNKLKQEVSVIKNIDLVVPVPLHWKKLKTRGYNQCDSFAQSLAETLEVPFSTTALSRVHENISQTKKKRLDRWGNVSEIFSVKDEQQLMGKHILLADDVVTTGATAEACLQTILKVNGTKVSFVAIASAGR